MATAVPTSSAIEEQRLEMFGSLPGKSLILEASYATILAWRERFTWV